MAIIPQRFIPLDGDNDGKISYVGDNCDGGCGYFDLRTLLF